MSSSSKALRPSHRSRLSHPTSLIDRHKSSLRKIDSLKAKQRLRESSNSRSAPKINTFSKKLLQKSESLSSYSRMEKTQQVLSKSRFMPKNIKVSLFALQNTEPIEVESVASKPDEHCFTVISQRSDSPKFYPSLIQKARPLSKNKSQQLPTDIEMRNKLLYNLREAATTRGFHTEHKEPPDLKDISKRSQFWLMKKKQKLEEAKASLDVKAKDQCTFRPLLQSKRNLSEFKGRSRSNSSSFSENRIKGLRGTSVKSRSSASVSRLIKPNSSVSSTPRSFLNENPYFAMSSYSKVTPIKMKLAYKHGFNSKIKNKARPMIDYREIRFNSDN